MTCIVVTIGGAGDVWRFDSVSDADTSPIVQYGDAVMSSVEDLRACYREGEYPHLAGRLEDRRLSETVERILSSPTVLPRDSEFLAGEVWASLTRSARVPPSDPSEIVKIVRADRVRSRTEGVTYRRRAQMSNTETATEETKKNRPIPRVSKYADTSVISLGSDKDGKQYGSDNNPKKAGSAAAGTFAKYVDGMTVAEAKAAGIDLRDLAYDSGKGFISIG